MVRKHIYFYGRVQGVGFRYSARYIANALMLSGWVKNNYDGSVEMEVQGDAKRVDELLDRLHSNHFIDIEYIDIKDIPTILESGFYVK